MTNKYGEYRFVHFADEMRDDPLDGGATVAYLVRGDALLYATAFCSSRDRFTKQYGRNRSMGLLRQYLTTTPNMTDTFEDIRKGFVKGTVADLARMMEDQCYGPRKDRHRGS